MGMTIEAVIFDCDGTLVDSETVAASVIAEMLAEEGIDTSREQILLRSRGEKFARFVAELCAIWPQLDADDFTVRYRRRSNTVLAAELQAMPGAVELVERLGLDKCVASNGPREKIEICLAATGLLPHFTDRIVSAYEVGSWKPDPDLIWHAAALMGVEPSRCLLVEDSRAGVEAGLAAGVQVVGYRLAADLRTRFDGRIRFADELAQIAEVLAAA